MNGNDPACPILASSLAELPNSNCAGLTKREWMAAHLLAAITTLKFDESSPLAKLSNEEMDAQMAVYAVNRTEALIAELNKPQVTT